MTQSDLPPDWPPDFRPRTEPPNPPPPPTPEEDRQLRERTRQSQESLPPNMRNFKHNPRRYGTFQILPHGAPNGGWQRPPDPPRRGLSFLAEFLPGPSSRRGPGA